MVKLSHIISKSNGLGYSLRLRYVESISIYFAIFYNILYYEIFYLNSLNYYIISNNADICKSGSTSDGNKLSVRLASNNSPSLR